MLLNFIGLLTFSVSNTKYHIFCLYCLAFFFNAQEDFWAPSIKILVFPTPTGYMWIWASFPFFHLLIWGPIEGWVVFILKSWTSLGSSVTTLSMMFSVVWYFMSPWYLFGWHLLWISGNILSWLMEEFIHWPKPDLLLSTTCDEILSWMKNHVVSDSNFATM